MKQIIKGLLAISLLMCSLLTYGYKVTFFNQSTYPLNVDYCAGPAEKCAAQAPIYLPYQNTAQTISLDDNWGIDVADVKDNNGNIIGGPYGTNCHGNNPPWATTFIFEEAAGVIVCIPAAGLKVYK